MATVTGGVQSELVTIQSELFNEVERVLQAERNQRSIDGLGPSMTGESEPGSSFAISEKLHSLLPGSALLAAATASDSWSALFDFGNGADKYTHLAEARFLVARYGGGPQFMNFVEAVLKSAHERARLQPGASTLATAATVLRDICGEIDHLAAGNSVEVPVIHYLHGVGLPAGTTTAIGVAKLHSIDAGRWGLLRDNRGAWSPEDAQRTGAMLQESTSVWLVMGHEYEEFDLAMRMDDPPPPPQFTPPADTPEHSSCLNHLRLAISLLRPNETDRIGTQYLSSRSLSYFGSSMSFSEASMGALQPVQLDRDTVESVVATVEHLGGIDLSTASIAIGRLVSATAARTDPTDQVIDAAIGLESLLGEASFVNQSIAVSLSSLLGSDQDERTSIYEESKRLYGRRSKIVHGGKLKPGESAHDVANEMIQLLKRALLAIIRDPVLLPMTAAERTKELSVRPRN